MGNRIYGWQLAKEKSVNSDFGFGFYLILWLKKINEEEKKINGKNYLNPNFFFIKGFVFGKM